MYNYTFFLGNLNLFFWSVLIKGNTADAAKITL